MAKNLARDEGVLTGARVIKEGDHHWRAELEILKAGKREVWSVGSFESIGNATAALENARRDAVKA